MTWEFLASSPKLPTPLFLVYGLWVGDQWWDSHDKDPAEKLQLLQDETVGWNAGEDGGQAWTLEIFPEWRWTAKNFKGDVSLGVNSASIRSKMICGFGRTPACGKTACFVILGLSLQGTSQLASKKLTLIQKMDALQMISYCYHIVLYDVLHVYIDRYLVFLLWTYYDAHSPKKRNNAWN